MCYSPTFIVSVVGPVMYSLTAQVLVNGVGSATVLE